MKRERRDAGQCEVLLLDPVDALRIIAAILADRGFSGDSARMAAVAVVLMANGKTGQSWASYKRLEQRYGLSRATIRRGLATAIGRYFVVHGRGQHGAICYRVLSASVSTGETLPLASISIGETLPDASVSTVETLPAPEVQRRSARSSTVEHILTPNSNQEGKGAASPRRDAATGDAGAGRAGGSTPDFHLSGDADRSEGNAQGDGKGDGQRLVGLWIVEFERRTGEAFAQGGRGRLAGTIKNMLASFTADKLADAIPRWFARGGVGGKFGVALFKHCLEDGDADLTGRPVDRRGATFTPAPTAGQSYNTVAQKFEATP